jgi:hypothetical protein
VAGGAKYQTNIRRHYFDSRVAATPRAQASLRLICNRPSDRRGPGKAPRPQCAFKMSMFNVSCNSH